MKRSAEKKANIIKIHADVSHANTKGFKTFRHFSNINSSQQPPSRGAGSQLPTASQLEDFLKTANLPPRAKIWEFYVFVFK